MNRKSSNLSSQGRQSLTIDNHHVQACTGHRDTQLLLKSKVCAAHFFNWPLTCIYFHSRPLNEFASQRRDGQAPSVMKGGRPGSK